MRQSDLKKYVKVKRHPTPVPYESKRKLAKLAQGVDYSCCAVACLKKLAEKYGQEQIQTYVADFVKRSPEERNNFFLQYFQTHPASYWFRDIEICELAFLEIYSTSQTTLKRRKQEASKGVLTFSNQYQRGYSCQRRDVIGWLTSFVETCDQMPDSDEIHAPSSLDRADVYDLYATTWKIENIHESKLCSLNTFYTVLREDFANLKFPKENRFAKCATCVSLKNALEAPGLTQTQKANLKLQKQQHHNVQMLERAAYYARRDLAKRDNTVTSLITDGMDQNKTNLPKGKRPTKRSDDINQYLAKTRVSGVKVQV
eukprot:Pompholyxophrys_punicea_v1_NODE_389_length_2073_cov_14.173439.p1 type:complete len:314 gc:universal NODE_389_length_2073_cov_14.173439:140-1081(+)